MLWVSLFSCAFSSYLGTFKQVKNHSAEVPEYFDQYYWEYDEFFDPVEGVVILKIGAESPALDPSGEKDWMHEVAKHFKGIVFTLQHRYYGKSHPFEDTKVEHLELLTVDQALQDYKTFHDGVKYSKTQQPLNELPWIAVGGSYPGVLSALLRKNYSEDFAAAISSAGVLYANTDYRDFDIQDAISMGQECASVARTVRRLLTNLWASDKDYVMNLFGFPEAIRDSDFDFQLIIAEMFTLGLQYNNVGAFCDPLVDTLRTRDDPVMVLAKYAKEVFLPGGLASWEDYSIDSLRDETLGNSSHSRCWFWQTCNELGYWQTYPGRVGLRSPILTKEGFEEKCQKVFGREMHPDADKWNQEHKVTRGAGVNHVIYTTDSQDPWTWACVTDDYEPVESDNWVHTVVGKEVGHHIEYNYPNENDPTDLKDTREKILKLLDQWVAGWRSEHAK